MSLMITAGITVLHEKRDDNPFGTPGLSQFFFILLLVSELLIFSLFECFTEVVLSSHVATYLVLPPNWFY